MSKLRVPAPEAASEAAAADRVYLTARTLSSVGHRRKPLPPDANASATKCQLYQLKQHVEFRCTKCRRDRIYDDSVAVDSESGVMMCARCFGRAVRPRVYKPTRLVPFPSLLSWLNYEEAPVQTGVAADVTKRGAEAALPSGHRINTQLIAPTSVANLPVTPMNPLGSELDAGSRLMIESNRAGASDAARAAADRRDVHPCVRVFGACAHGPVCFFRNAPYNLSLTYLMGLRENSPSEECTAAFGLPPTLAPARGTPAFDKWLQERRNSDNQAEWQLWNQPGTMALVEALLPAAAQAKAGQGDDADGVDSPADAPAAGMSMTALKSFLTKL